MSSLESRLLLSIVLIAPAVALAGDPPTKKKNSAIAARLDKQLISVDFKNDYPEDIADYLSSVTGISTVFDGSAHLLSKKITIKLGNVTVRTLLAELEKQCGVQTKVACGALVFGSAKGLKKFPYSPKAFKAVTAKDKKALKSAERHLSFNFKETALSDVALFIKGIAGLEVFADPQFKAGGVLSLSATKISILEFLTLVASKRGGTLGLEEGRFVLLGHKKKP